MRIPGWLVSPQTFVLGFGASVLAAAFIIPAVATTESGPLQVNDAADRFAIEGNTTRSGGIGVAGQNAGASAGAGVMGKNAADHGIGVEGTSTNASYGTGVYGTSKSGPGVSGFTSSAYPGVTGSSTYPFGTGVAGMSSGDAVYGVSTGENGVVGIARGPVPPTGNKVFAGVLGIDTSTGHAGSEFATNYGVAGLTSNVFGAATAGFGSGGATGMLAETDIGAALIATETRSVGEAILAQYENSGQSYGVQGLAGGTGSVGVYGDSFEGTGVQGYGITGLAGATFAPPSPSTTTSALYLTAASEANYELEAYCSDPGGTGCNKGPSALVMSVDPQGNMKLAGSVDAANVTQSTASNSTTSRRAAYDTTSASPTLEDAGVAELVSGVATVRLDAAFADSIDRSSDYLVFVTPQGDTAGLYVASHTPQAFVVREHGGGRSNLAFDYRIVARPAGRRDPRLPMLTLPHRRVGPVPSFAAIKLPVRREAPTAGVVSPRLQ